MNQAAYQELTKMLNAFPQTGDIAALLLTYDEDLTGISDLAIIETAQKYRRNGITRRDNSFAPSIPQFKESAEEQEKLIEARNRPRIEAPKHYFGTGRTPFERNRDRALAANEHLPVLFTDIGYDQWCKLSKAKEIPVGAKWVACLGIVYGPARAA